MKRIEDEIKEIIDCRYGSIPKFAKLIGVSPQTIYTALKKGLSGASVATVMPIVAELGLDPVWLLNNRLIEKDNYMPDFVDVPLYGSIAAGTPIEMIEVEDTHPIPTEIHDRFPNAFLLKVKGESMNRVIPNGCYVLVDPCDVVDRDMEPYAVCVNGFDATVKRIRTLSNGFELVPDSTDPTYKPTVYDYGEPDTQTVTVIGRVVWYTLPFDWRF